jgi:hypothetical protein
VPLPDTALVGRFPCHPTRQERRIEVGGRPLTLLLLSCEKGDVVYGLATADVEDPAQVDPVLSLLAESARHGIGAVDPPAVPFAVPGVTPYRGNVSLRLEGHRPDGRPIQESVDVFARGTRVFQATAIGSTLAEPAVQPFHAGLRFRGIDADP